MRYGSDLIVDWLADLGIDNVAFNPGATLRGLHDSLVRSESVRPILALHEEIAVGIAHGYAKAKQRPMAVFLHDLVGLQHASMAIFNAWVDRVPVLIIGGSGPRSEENRRPWLDWIHTGLPQGLIVRDIVKWDTEPATLSGVRESLHRALRTACSGPQGPVYVSIDAGLQEQSVDLEPTPLSPVDVSTLAAPPEVVQRVCDRLTRSRCPVFVADRPVAGLSDSLVRLAETLGAAVVDLGGGANFPTTHWADQSSDRQRALSEADVVIAFEVRDLAWAVTDTDTATRAAISLVAPGVPIIAVGLSELRHSGFLVPEASVPEAEHIVGDARSFGTELARALEEEVSSANNGERQRTLEARHQEARAASALQARSAEGNCQVHPGHLAWSLWQAVKDGPWQLANGLLGGWPRRLWDITDETQYLGRSGGEGLGYGLPASLGAAMANGDSDVVVVDIQGDGDFMYTPSALWTAAHHRIPLLIVMHNNRAYGKDELHQAEMARMRGRSSHVVPIGIHLDGPPVDFAGLARSQGVEAIGPIDDPGEVTDALSTAAKTVRNERRPFLVDVVCGSGR